MDDYVIQSLENLLCQKIMLYDDLLNCFYSERESLKNMDIDELWIISKKKEEICSNIKSIRSEIISSAELYINQEFFSLDNIIDLIPKENRAGFHKLNLTVTRLKREIDVSRKENMIFVNDSLRFLDEIISIITGESNARMMYNDKCRLSQSRKAMLLSKEA